VRAGNELNDERFTDYSVSNSSKKQELLPKAQLRWIGQIADTWDHCFGNCFEINGGR